MQKVIVVGGGAAGFFSAINIAEKYPNVKIIILEGGKEVLQKVKVSGGGRCNITNACFDPKELITFYPRGAKELLGPFHQFMTGDTMQWFEDRGVPLKVEDDGRVFPKANTSQAVIDCFQNKTKTYGITILTNHRVSSFYPQEEQWIVKTKEKMFVADKLIIASGSSAKIWQQLEQIRHTIVSPVPSLFTFSIKDERIADLGGISVLNATVKIEGEKIESNGTLLITHWGLSGPAILKLSAFGARILAQKKYRYEVEVNWLSKNTNEVFEELQNIKIQNAKRHVVLKSPFLEIPKRLWERLVESSGVTPLQNWANTNRKQLQNIALQLTKTHFKGKGKSTFKEEFVTAGGVDLKEVDFKKMESKLHKNLFFAGEVLNIDAVTGGFNFQNAWTTAWIASQSISLFTNQLSKETI